MRTAIFDLDGTLADTAADLIRAANAALAEAGLTGRLAMPADRAAALAGGRAMLKLGFARADVDGARMEHLYPRLLEHYRAAICVETCLYDGVLAMIDALAARGWRLGICTNKPEPLAEALLAALGVRARFAAVVGPERLGLRKPDPRHLLETIDAVGGDPRAAVLIGDTITDLGAARAAGIPCVLVGFGPEGAAVAELGPEAVLAHYDDLPDLVERLVPSRPAREPWA